MVTVVILHVLQILITAIECSNNHAQYSIVCVFLDLQMWMYNTCVWMMLKINSYICQCKPQFLHPFEVRNYREVARTLRVIGRNCIQKRIKALNDGKDVPHDILSYIIKAASKHLYWQCISNWICIICLIASDVTADIESLVDDFVTFYIAGEMVLLFVCTCVCMDALLCRTRDHCKHIGICCGNGSSAPWSIGEDSVGGWRGIGR